MIALNAHDYATSNPELGWLEDGVISNCYDLPDSHSPLGFFTRILGGGWIDWQAGMEVQHSDSVINNGRLYRVAAKVDGTIYKSITAPVHESGIEVIDGILWAMVQDYVTYTAGVRNVVFRDIFLQKARVSFSVHFDNDRHSRSYYPGAANPLQSQISLENIHVQHDEDNFLFEINTPVDIIRLKGSAIKNNRILFYKDSDIKEYKKTAIIVMDCSFTGMEPHAIIDNQIPGKEFELITAGNVILQTFQFMAVNWIRKKLFDKR